MAERILEHVKRLPESLQAQVLDFVEYLESKVGSAKSSAENGAWSAFSLFQAMRGMESESSPYSMDDLKEVFR